MKEERKPQIDGKKSQKKAIDTHAIKNKLDILEEVFEWIAEGKTLRDFCRQEGKPAYRTIYYWLQDNEEAFARFTRAREIGADVIADDALSIIDAVPERAVSQYSNTVDSGHVSWQKARAEFRLKLLAKWFPQKYGDKTKVEHEGGVSLNIITGVPDGEA